jgi:hypothetical protein
MVRNYAHLKNELVEMNSKTHADFTFFPVTVISFRHRRRSYGLFTATLFLTTLIIITACSRTANIADNRLTDYLDIVLTPSPTETRIASPTSMPSKTLATPTQIPFSYNTERLYLHPQGLFDFPMPQGWEIEREDEGFVEFSNAELNASFNIFVTNTGTSLDRTAFTRFVEAQESNFFRVYSDYQESEKYYNHDGIDAMVVKTFLNEGQQKRVASFYTQEGQTVLTLHLWLDSPLTSPSIPLFSQFFKEIQIYPMKIVEQPVYRWVYEYRDEQNSYRLLVPLQWRLKSVISSSAQVVRFESPDQRGAVQVTLYDDGEPMSSQDAGFIVLELLKKVYGNELSILDDRYLAGDFERLSWRLKDGTTSGTTFFDIKNSRITMLTMDYPDPEEDQFLDLYQVLASSFQYLDPY